MNSVYKITGLFWQNCALRVLSLLEESTLPFSFDIVCYNTIRNPNLLRHIQEYGQVLFTGEPEPPRTD